MPLPRRFVSAPVWRALLMLAAFTLMLAQARAQDFRDPPGQAFTLWPNIPVVRAADLAEYAQDRQAFADLHADKGDPAKLVAALQAVDNLQVHHERFALMELGRSINAQLIAALDQLARQHQLPRPRLRVSFEGITPADLQRPQALDKEALEALKTRAGQVALAAYITYTRLDGTLVQATLTLVRLASGASQSFSATASAPQLAQQLAQQLFDYFEGTRFAPQRNPLASAQWLGAAPGHADLLVARDAAQRYCQSQQARLPSARELESAQALGFHGGGVTLRAGAYHIDGGLYATDPALAGMDKVRANHLSSVPNGYYYCIRTPQPPARAARARK